MISRHPEKTRMQGKKQPRAKIAAVLNSLKTGDGIPVHDSLRQRTKLDTLMTTNGIPQRKQSIGKKIKETKTAKNNRKNQMKMKAILCILKISCLLEFVAVS